MSAVKPFGVEVCTFVVYNLFWICWQTYHFAVLARFLRKSFYRSVQVKKYHKIKSDITAENTCTLVYTHKNYFIRKETTVFNDSDGVNDFCACFFNGGSTHCLANSLPCPTRQRLNNDGKFESTSLRLQQTISEFSNIRFQICFALFYRKERTSRNRQDNYPALQTQP